MLAAGTLTYGLSQVFSIIWVMGILTIGYFLPIQESFITPDPRRLPLLEFLTLVFLVLLIGILTATAQQSLRKFKNSQERFIHEAHTNKQLSAFNAKLQAYAKKTKEKTNNVKI